MTWPEPSMRDCGAPWNEEEIEDENGDIHIVCGCTGCRAGRAKMARDEREIDDYEEDKKGWQ